MTWFVAKTLGGGGLHSFHKEWWFCRSFASSIHTLYMYLSFLRLYLCICNGKYQGRLAAQNTDQRHLGCALATYTQHLIRKSSVSICLCCSDARNYIGPAYDVQNVMPQECKYDCFPELIAHVCSISACDWLGVAASERGIYVNSATECFTNALALASRWRGLFHTGIWPL